MMINNENELGIVREQLQLAESALLALKNEVLPESQERFLLMSECYLDQINDLRELIDDFVGAKAATESAADLVIALKGVGVRLGTAPASLVTGFVDKLRRGLQVLAEHAQSGKEVLRRGGRRSKWIEAACDPPLVAIQTGSVKVTLGMPDTKSLFDKDAHQVFEEAFSLLKSGLSWASEGDPKAALEMAQAPGVEYAVLTVVRSLIPPKESSVEEIIFSGRMVGKSSGILLTRKARSKITREIKRLGTVAGYTEVEGTVREIDLDSRSFSLRERGEKVPDVLCSYTKKLESLVVQCLDKHVSVAGQLVVNRKSQKQSMKVQSVSLKNRG